LGLVKGYVLVHNRGAGALGLGIIAIPDIMRSMFGWPSQDPIVYGVAGSVWFAFGILSVLGLRSPLKFVPVLLLQLCYKVVWFVGVVFPLLVAGKFPMYAILHVAASLVANASGAVKVKTVVLLTPEEVDQAVKKTVEYRPPGQ
jgi:hypothetical protein